MIKEDSISQMSCILAIMIVIYLSTFTGFLDLLLIPLALVLGGLGLQFYLKGKVEHDVSLSKTEVKATVFYVLMALAGIGLGSMLIPGLFDPPKLPWTLSVFDQYLYGTLYAIAEERFFRGFLTPFLMLKFSAPLIANMLSGAVFSIYHFSVYGASIDKLMYVFIAGVILSYVTLKSQRITPATLGHIGNNALVVPIR